MARVKRKPLKEGRRKKGFKSQYEERTDITRDNNNSNDNRNKTRQCPMEKLFSIICSHARRCSSQPGVVASGTRSS